VSIDAWREDMGLGDTKLVNDCVHKAIVGTSAESQHRKGEWMAGDWTGGEGQDRKRGRVQSSVWTMSDVETFNKALPLRAEPVLLLHRR